MHHIRHPMQLSPNRRLTASPFPPLPSPHTPLHYPTSPPPCPSYHSSPAHPGSAPSQPSSPPQPHLWFLRQPSSTKGRKRRMFRLLPMIRSVSIVERAGEGWKMEGGRAPLRHQRHNRRGHGAWKGFPWGCCWRPFFWWCVLEGGLCVLMSF